MNEVRFEELEDGRVLVTVAVEEPEPEPSIRWGAVLVGVLRLFIVIPLSILAGMVIGLVGFAILDW